MSLLSNIQARKNNLKGSPTIVTKLTGEKFLETVDSNGLVHEKRLVDAPRCAGYIIDTKPDLQVVHVLPSLLLGSQDVACDAAILAKESVTDIISIGVKPWKTFKRIHYETIDLLDLPEANLIEVLKVTNALLDNALKHGRNVFVHCNAGYSRAPAVVIGYLMHSQHLEYEEAYQRIATQRVIKPNDGFIRQLQHFPR